MKPAWRTVFLVAVLVGVLWLGYLARAVVTPLLVAVLLAYVFDPVVRRLQRLGLSRSAASGIVVVTTLIVIGGLGGWGGARVVEETGVFVHDVAGEPFIDKKTLGERARIEQSVADGRTETFDVAPVTWRGEEHWYIDLDRDGEFRPGLARQTSAKVTEVLEKSVWTKALAKQIGDKADLAPLVASSASEWVKSIFESGRQAAGTALFLLTMLVLFPIYLYYALSTLPHVYSIGVQHLPGAHRERVVVILAKIHATLAAFFRGRLILLAVRFVFLMAVFVAFDTPFAAVCAAFGTACSLVPILGSVASIAVPLTLGVAAGASGGNLLGLLIVLVAYEVVEQYVLTPSVVGRSVGLHPLTILVGTLVAGELLGIFGMVVAIPILAVSKILWIEFVMPEIRRHAGLAEPPKSDVLPPAPACDAGVIRSAALSELPGIAHAHSERADGALGPRGSAGVQEARTRFALLVAGEPDALVVPEQVHGDAVAIVSARERGRGHGTGPAIARTDGLVTAARRLALLVQGADCPLVALAEPDAGIVGAFHSGWRGTAAGIGARAVETMRALGARPERARAAVFPGIGACCFEVGPEVRAAFVTAFGQDATAWFASRDTATDRLFLDLRAAIVRTLRDAGVAEVDVVPGCTACGGNLWSHRGSRGGPERHGLVIARV